MKIVQYFNKLYNSCSYILQSADSDYVWLIDIGDYSEIKKRIPETSIIRGVFLTHTHIDHIYGIKSLNEDYHESIIYTSEYGVNSLSSSKMNLSLYHDEPIEYSGSNVLILKGGDKLELFPGILIEVFETPGHDWSCLSYKCEHYFFTGDSLIPGHKVITKLKGGDRKANIESLKMLFSLFDNKTVICPGHGEMINYSQSGQATMQRFTGKN